MATRKESLEIDEGLFREVRRILGTRTLRETAEEAFKEILRARARREEVEALGSMRGMDLDDREIMAEAWRSPTPG